MGEVSQAVSSWVTVEMNYFAHLDAYTGGMRTTVDLADDVASAVHQLRRNRSIGLSEAVNELIRAGLTRRDSSPPFRQKTHDLGRATIDYGNIADAIESADGPASH